MTDKLAWAIAKEVVARIMALHKYEGTYYAQVTTVYNAIVQYKNPSPQIGNGATPVAIYAGLLTRPTATERFIGDAFKVHCEQLHHADFDVCSDPNCVEACKMEHAMAQGAK